MRWTYRESHDSNDLLGIGGEQRVGHVGISLGDEGCVQRRDLSPQVGGEVPDVLALLEHLQRGKATWLSPRHNGAMGTCMALAVQG